MERGESEAGLSWRITAKSSAEDHARSSFSLDGRKTFAVSLPQSFLPHFAGDVVPIRGVRPTKETAVLGLLSSRVKRVEIRVEGAATVVTHPIPPAPRRKSQVCWLRNVSYLATFLAPGNHVERVTAYDKSGDEVYSAYEHRGGSFHRDR